MKTNRLNKFFQFLFPSFFIVGIFLLIMGFNDYDNISFVNHCMSHGYSAAQNGMYRASSYSSGGGGFSSGGGGGGSFGGGGGGGGFR